MASKSNNATATTSSITTADTTTSSTAAGGSSSDSVEAETRSANGPAMWQDIKLKEELEPYLGKTYVYQGLGKDAYVDR
jgi:hypothetical protein